jgi:hypothetical protein
VTCPRPLSFVSSRAFSACEQNTVSKFHKLFEGRKKRKRDEKTLRGVNTAHATDPAPPDPKEWKEEMLRVGTNQSTLFSFF